MTQIEILKCAYLGGVLSRKSAFSGGALSPSRNRGKNIKYKSNYIMIESV